MTALAGVTSAFVARHQGWVRKQAQAIVRHLPANVERDDLIQAGLIAIAHCAVSFEETGEPDAFERYARQRVKGAMLDELRGMDPLSRDDRRKAKLLQRQAGTLGERAAAAGMPIAEAAALLHADIRAHTAIDVDQEDVHRQAELGINHPRTAHDHTEEAADRATHLRRLHTFCAGLNARERLVMDAYLGAGSTPIEAAAVLGVTPSRVSQLFAGLVARISKYRSPPAAKPEPEPLDIFAADIVRGCTTDLLTRRMG